MPAAVNSTLTAERVAALKVYEAAKLSTKELLSLTARPRIDFTSILQTVRTHMLRRGFCQAGSSEKAAESGLYFRK